MALFRKLMVLVSVALLASLAMTATAAPVSAGKGHGNGKGGSTTDISATLAVTPNPAPASSVVRVSGTGYDYTTWVEVQVVAANGQVVAAYTGAVWFDSHIDFSITAPAIAGTYTLNAYQTLNRSKTLVAQTVMGVY
ncbi:MAG: hypothetical protein HYU86_08405 [Chloroflexi bacterium]|nr:hypothetical protein [Chloroflexota bacterium]